jgi:uncharacterized low-complexity protein
MCKESQATTTNTLRKKKSFPNKAHNPTFIVKVNNMKNSIKPMVASVGAAFLMAAGSSAFAAENPFAAQQLNGGYAQLADASKTKEASCGAAKKTEEAKCGADKKAEEGKCGEAKCGADKKAEEGKCGEAKCGADKKAEEGKCGEAKCGADKKKSS